MLSPIQQATLLAAVDRIIPADDYPSASQAGALQFITRLLDGDLRSAASMFCSALDALHEEAILSQGKPLSELSETQQDLVLQSLEDNNTKADWPMFPPTFLQMITRLATEGYYSDPANGGNKYAISWKMVGYDPGANGPDATYLARK